MKILLDPKVFNYVIMALYTTNIINYLVRGRLGDACYWLAALGITASVTWVVQLNALRLW